jgi:hypothetical protein
MHRDRQPTENGPRPDGDRAAARRKAPWDPPRIQAHGSIRNLVRGASKPAGDSPGPTKKAQ